MESVTGLYDEGLSYLSFPAFGMRTTLALFHSSGRSPAFRQAVYIATSSSMRESGRFWRTMGWIPSGPAAFLGLKRLMDLMTLSLFIHHGMFPNLVSVLYNWFPPPNSTILSCWDPGKCDQSCRVLKNITTVFRFRDFTTMTRPWGRGLCSKKRAFFKLL